MMIVVTVPATTLFVGWDDAVSVNQSLLCVLLVALVMKNVRLVVLFLFTVLESVAKRENLPLVYLHVFVIKIVGIVKVGIINA